MINTQFISKLKVFVFFATALLSFNSCSSDDDNGDGDCLPGISAISADAIRAYQGALTLNATEVINQDGTATITESGCKTYTISFSDGVPSITGVRFITTNNGESFTYVNANATTTVTINEDGRLSVAKSDSPIITFSSNSATN
ncbi:hypothetical protein [uncultured Algibacter sp.]|uniref:hypothetical protein n=1 Tax=uncultured Algibacter sp. TaxID=298659 RepID=UPI0032163B96